MRPGAHSHYTPHLRDFSAHRRSLSLDPVDPSGSERSLAMMKRIPSLALIPLALLAGCGESGTDDTASSEPASAEAAQALSRKQEAKRLFEEETFGGNGRTCATCHG